MTAADIVDAPLPAAVEAQVAAEPTAKNPDAVRVFSRFATRTRAFPTPRAPETRTRRPTRRVRANVHAVASRVIDTPADVRRPPATFSAHLVAEALTPLSSNPSAGARGFRPAPSPSDATNPAPSDAPGAPRRRHGRHHIPAHFRPRRARRARLHGGERGLTAGSPTRRSAPAEPPVRVSQPETEPPFPTQTQPAPAPTPASTPAQRLPDAEVAAAAADEDPLQAQNPGGGRVKRKPPRQGGQAGAREGGFRGTQGGLRVSAPRAFDDEV